VVVAVPCSLADRQIAASVAEQEQVGIPGTVGDHPVVGVVVEHVGFSGQWARGL